MKNTQFQLEGFISTPPLWKRGCCYGLKSFTFSPANFESAIDIEAYQQELESIGVLGKRAETFFEMLMASSKKYRVLASRLQIIQEKITLGELDFILKDRFNHKIIHVELVYKFYIYDPSFPNEMERWIGPNRRDSLVRKINRLRDHQLPLLYKNATKAKLQELGIDVQNIEQQVYFPANLFLPRNLQISSITGFNDNCLTGFWIHRKEFTIEEYSHDYFYTPKKPDWPVLPQKNTSWFTYHEIVLQVDVFIKNEQSPLIWMKTSTGEFLRFFIVWW